MVKALGNSNRTGGRAPESAAAEYGKQGCRPHFARLLAVLEEGIAPQALAPMPTNLVRHFPTRLGKAAHKLTRLGERPTSKAEGRCRDFLPHPFHSA